MKIRLRAFNKDNMVTKKTNSLEYLLFCNLHIKSNNLIYKNTITFYKNKYFETIARRNFKNNYINY
ncbi:MAG: hypothetical protein A2X12_07160 [Bacteroidetes bacterium GWE2_29_8]|nr:MAG: hypothetical protein A2X12_07160 [Bacteroidetes bacterium GWE2_29_8]